MFLWEARNFIKRCIFSIGMREVKDSMDSNEKIVRSILITFLVTAVFICGCGFVLLRYTTVLDGVWMQRNESTGKITSVMENVLNGYIEELDEETLIDGAMKGMLEAVDDPYTFYLTAEEYENMEASRSPSYTGIGVTVNMVDVPDAMLILSLIHISFKASKGWPLLIS